MEYQEALGESAEFLHFQDHLSLAAKVNRPVLLVGERGTGKELAARRLHYLSPRWQGPLVTLNCATLSPTLLESELFGHEAGSFTGAKGTRRGRFEEAHHGTLFLDEMGLIPLEVQEKILRVVEYGTFERVGSSRSYEVDVRIVGATNADLEKLCEQGKFKRDLLDRISFEILYLPPLRFRGRDLFLLAKFFGQRMLNEMGLRETIRWSSEVEREMLNHRWPGNIRELKNVIERAVYKSGSGMIEQLNLHPFSNPYDDAPINDSFELRATPKLAASQIPLGEYRQWFEAMEREIITRALKESGGVQSRAAEILDLTYDQFRGLYRKHNNA